LTEYYLNQFLVITSSEEIVNIDNLSYAQKLQQAEKDKFFRKKTLMLLTRLNKLRNKVGHELEYKLSESDIDSLGYVFGKKYIIDKYEVSDKKELLHRYMIKIVICISTDTDFAIRHYKSSIEASDKM
jgi:hypothetical protein